MRINEERIWACRSAKWFAPLSEVTSQHSGPTEWDRMLHINHYIKSRVRKVKSRCLYWSKSCAEVSRCFALARTLRVVGGAKAGEAAIAQVLLQEGAPASSPGKYLWAGTDFGHYLPDLDSSPLPRVAPRFPRRSPLYGRRESQPSPSGRRILLAAVRGAPCFLWRRWR